MGVAGGPQGYVRQPRARVASSSACAVFGRSTQNARRLRHRGSAMARFGDDDVEKLKQFEAAANPNDPQQAALLDEMKKHVEKLSEMRKNEDPRVSFSTPEFKKAQRTFQDNFKKNFGRPVEWAMVKEHPWSTPQLRKIPPQTVDGEPWPLDADGKPIIADA